MKIHLTNEMETLLIPLYGRAVMSSKGFFSDPFAEEAIHKLDYNFSDLRIQEKTQIMMSLRSAIIDDFSGDYLSSNPAATVLHLGCGLDARYFRLGLDRNRNNGSVWYDLDFPEVTAIKSRLYPETEDYRFISASVTEPSWVNSAKCPGDSLLVIAEGLFMYLPEAEIKTLLQRLKTEFGKYIIIFDAYSVLTAKSAGRHPSLKRTGAQIKWGVNSAEEIAGLADSAVHLGTFYFTDRESIERLPAGYKAMFRFAGFFKAAREAHRVFAFAI